MSYRILQADTPIDRTDYPADAIFFFDFDGVLATQDEEKVFRLPAGEGEREKLEWMAADYNVDHRLYPDTGYLRHLVFQGAAEDRRVVPHKPMIDFVTKLQFSGKPWHVVTARSGTWAVRRLMDFLYRRALDPQEVFCLGRSSKAALLAELRTDWPDRPFVYFEDSKKHLDACVALDDPNLHIVEVQWPADTSYAQYLLDAMYAA